MGGDGDEEAQSTSIAGSGATRRGDSRGTSLGGGISELDMVRSPCPFEGSGGSGLVEDEVSL